MCAVEPQRPNCKLRLIGYQKSSCTLHRHTLTQIGKTRTSNGTADRAHHTGDEEQRQTSFGNFLLSRIKQRFIWRCYTIGSPQRKKKIDEIASKEAEKMAKPESHRKQHVIIILLPVCCLFLSLLGSVTIFVAMKNERQTYGRWWWWWWWWMMKMMIESEPLWVPTSEW